jgi:hypothetical protein
LYHLSEDGKIYKIIGPGALILADPDDPEAIAFRRTLEETDAIARAEEARREEALRRIQQAESQKNRSEPPPWRRV